MTGTELSRVADAELLQHIPQEVLGELRRFGPLETKTADELKEKLLQLRQMFVIPPWHVLTLLFQKQAVVAVGGSGKNQQSWFRTNIIGRSEYHDVPIGQKTWCDLIATVTNLKGQTVTVRYAVNPEMDIAWSMHSEASVRRASVTHAERNADGTTTFFSIPRTALIETAKKALAQGHTECSFDYHCGEHFTGPYHDRYKTRERVTSERKAKISKPPSVTQEQAPEPVKTADVLDRSSLLVMFDLACIKAREVGMECTITMWERKLKPLLEGC